MGKSLFFTEVSSGWSVEAGRDAFTLESGHIPYYWIDPQFIEIFMTGTVF